MKYSSNLVLSEILERKHQCNFLGENYESGDEALELSMDPSRVEIQLSSDVGNTPRLIGFDCNVRRRFRPLGISKGTLRERFRSVGKTCFEDKSRCTDRTLTRHLRIKRFLGTSENAVRTQIWCAVSTYVLIAIVKKELQLHAPLYTLLQILSVSVFEKNQLSCALQSNLSVPETLLGANQLNLFNF
jgi:hypothetical protein